MAQIFKDAKGNYVAVKADGTQVPVLPSLGQHATVTGFAPVMQEQGVSGFQRFTVKNLASNPESARGYLEQIGYEVRPYGGGFNFAVRPKNAGPRVPWKVVDPDGMDPQDIFDLTADAISIGAQSLAAVAVAPTLAAGPAGVATEAAAVGGTASGVEVLRQGIGSAVGVPDNADMAGIALSGAGGAASVPIGRAVSSSLRSAGRFGGKMLRGVAARFAGIEGGKALPGADALLEAAEWSVAHPGQLMRTPEDAAEIVRAAVKRIGSQSFPEKAQALAMAKQAAQNGTTLNIRPLVDGLQANMHMPTSYVNVPGQTAARGVARTPELEVAHGVDPTLQENLERVMATVYALIRNDTASALPIDRAVLVKNYLQRLAKQKGAYMQSPPGKGLRDILTTSAKALAGEIEQAMTNAGHPNYVSTMRTFENKTNMLHDWSKAMLVRERGAEAAQSRVNFIRSLYSDSKTNWLSALDDLETTFGVGGLKDAVKEAHIGSVTGMNQPGGPSLLGRGARSTLGIGALAFGHPTIAAVELGATSPKVVMGLTKAGLQASKVAGPLTAAGARGGAMLVTQQVAKETGKGISRDDAARPRRKTRIGL